MGATVTRIIMNQYTQLFANGCTDEAIDLAINKGCVIVTEKIVLDYPMYVQMMHHKQFYRAVAISAMKGYKAGAKLRELAQTVSEISEMFETFKKLSEKVKFNHC